MCYKVVDQHNIDCIFSARFYRFGRVVTDEVGMHTQLVSNKKVLSGNEAIAHGAYLAGAQVASAYPGTPSTEILQNLAAFPDVYCEWAVNEKVAMEVAIGASFAGAKALAAMKHVGLNVALDPLMTFAYMSSGGALVVVTADDPGMHSSQNEQDNRILAKFAKIPMLEPADSQECFEMVQAAFHISQEFSIPVILRTTTRVSHSSSIVDLGASERSSHTLQKYEKDLVKTLAVPMFARKMRVVLEGKLERLAKFSETSPFQRVERGNGIGIVTSGISYHYAIEAFPEASFLKLGMTFPLPDKLVRNFAESVDKLYVIEEGEPFLEDQIKVLGIVVQKAPMNIRIGELNPERVTMFACKVKGWGNPQLTEAIVGLPPRPPVLCPGCSHRGVFYALRRLNALVTGDIGCYTLGSFPPLSAMDTAVCMGASVGNAHGFEKAGYEGPVVGVIGDSTFFHSGITGLLSIVYNGGGSTIVVLDNRITAMTGHQDNPGTGRTLMGEKAVEVSVEQVARGVGVKRVRVIDPYDLEETYSALKEEIEAKEPSVVISKRECVLGARIKTVRRFAVDMDVCSGCGACRRLGCPAIEAAECVDRKPKQRKSRINEVLCVGCGLCPQVCRFDAIKEEV